ncbi:MAG: histidinol-phosphate transaminase [Candidatus Omnitrophica bacterium]|nr:histidinol-phosphate transaminase [Candidatus Omnitrophota bacterium]
MKSQAKQTIFKVQPYIPGRPIEDVKRELGLKDVVKLASNENPYPSSPKVIKAISVAAKSINRYPDGGCYALRQELAKQLKVKPEQLIFGNGSDEVIVMAVRAFVSPGDEVVLAKPSFLVYEIASCIEGATLKAIPLLPDFKYDLKAMKAAVTDKTKIIFLGNPDNPSGQYLTKDELTWFLDGLRKDILIFIDEAYYEYVNAKDYPDTLQLLKTYPNIFVARTFSKMYGLAGLRVGYGIGASELVDIIGRVREPFNINSIAQEAALACLKDKAYYKSIALKINQQRKYLYSNLSAMGLEFVKSYTNFVLIKVAQGGKAVSQALLKKGVIVRDMSVWGKTEYFRLSIGAFDLHIFRHIERVAFKNCSPDLSRL